MSQVKNKPFVLPDPLVIDEAMVANGVSMNIVKAYIEKHAKRIRRYSYLENLYKGFHNIYQQPEKESWKPDNRLVANFPRYITDTFMGYAYGNPIKKSHEDEAINEALKNFDRDNEITDHDFELFKNVCIYGHAFEYLYQDEERRTKMTVVKPDEMFVVYDDTVKHRALFAVRYGYHDTDGDLSTKDRWGNLYGEILTRNSIERFEKGVKVPGEVYENPYGYIPVVEYKMNEERIGLYEPITGLTEEYNHTISEKANDVDAFAEAYLAILGAEVDEDGVQRIRDDRVINIYGTDDAKDILVQFLTKPTADATQENLLQRLERLIYQISMVANISDENYGQSTSGVALAYKTQAMSNLALGFDRKIEKSMRKRYKIFCSLNTNVSDKDAWMDIDIKMSRNLPKNRQEETQTARDAEGIVSKETQLSLLSYVPDPKEELDRIEKENEEQMQNRADSFDPKDLLIDEDEEDEQKQ